MTKSQEAVAGLSRPKDLAAFLVSPKEYVRSKGLELDDDATTQALERYARTLIENVNAANRSVGLSELEDSDWGIGAGCCNSKAMFR